MGYVSLHNRARHGIAVVVCALSVLGGLRAEEANMMPFGRDSDDEPGLGYD